MAGKTAGKEGKDCGVYSVKAENQAYRTGEIEQEATENGETNMRKGQWAGFEGVRVVNGKLVQEGKPETAETKYHNIRVQSDDGIRFDSKSERNYYERNLLPRYKSGQVKWFIRQVRFDLPGKIIYRADFLEIWKDNSIHIIDCKGYRTYPYKMKKKLLESAYPVRITEVK